MQTPYSNTIQADVFFSRERRRQRLLQFLETFERRSWRCAQEIPFLLPLTKADVREAVPVRLADSRID